MKNKHKINTPPMDNSHPATPLLKEEDVMKKQNKVKCETCGDSGETLQDHPSNSHPSNRFMQPCPDCTTSQPTDEEITGRYPLLKKKVEDLIKHNIGGASLSPVDYEMIGFYESRETLRQLARKIFRKNSELKTTTYKQSAKLKQQSEEISELQEENNALSISIRKVTDDREELSSLLSEAVEILRRVNEVSITYQEFSEELEETLKKLQQHINRECV